MGEASRCSVIEDYAREGTSPPIRELQLLGDGSRQASSGAPVARRARMEIFRGWRKSVEMSVGWVMILKMRFTLKNAVCCCCRQLLTARAAVSISGEELDL